MPKLKMLYLHGNNISDLRQMAMLGWCTELTSFTVHGNPIESREDRESTDFKWYVLAHTPMLKSLNFTGLSKADRAAAVRYRQSLARRKGGGDSDED